MSKELGKVLREARREMGLTQDQVARHLQISRSAVGQWENGEDPSTDNLIRICDRLGIEVQAAIEGRLQHKEGFKPVQKIPDLSGVIDENRKPLPIEVYPFNQDNFFVNRGLIPYHPVNEWPEDESWVTPISAMFFAPRPPNLPPINSLYMIGIVTSPLEPLIKSMSMVYVDSGAIPSVGDPVFLRMRGPLNGDNKNDVSIKHHEMQRCFIGYLVRFTPVSVTIQQTSPERYIQVNVSEVMGMHPILSPQSLTQG